MKSKEEIKLDFFKQFGNESFRGYSLEQCHAIWEFFEKYVQCQEDMAKRMFSEEDLENAFTQGFNARYNMQDGLESRDNFMKQFKNKQD